MSIIIGGAFAAGAFLNGMVSETASIPVTELSQWAQLRADPLGRPYTDLRTRISKADYDNYPGLNKYRSELAGVSTLTTWGPAYTYQWRMIVPRDWYSLGAASIYVVGQIHDVNGTAVGRRPTLAIEIADSTLQVVLSNDAYPNGFVIWSTPVVAGKEYELTASIRWADGVNAPDALGFLNLYLDGAQVPVLGGFAVGRNTWAPAAPGAEPNPPYIKCGVYQAGPAFSWWAGKSATMFYPSCAVGSAEETATSLRALIDAQLAGAPNTAIA